MPDLKAREHIWKTHLSYEGVNIPVDGINIKFLAEKYNFFCGREIKKAVLYACVAVAMKIRRIKSNIHDLKVTQEDFINACEKVIKEADEVSAASDHTDSKKIFTQEEQDELKNVMQVKIDHMNQAKKQ